MVPGSPVKSSTELNAIDSQHRSDRETSTLSLADRFDTVLDSGRRIASALTPAAIHEAAQAAALRLLRGRWTVLY